MENNTVIESTAIPVNTMNLSSVLHIPAVRQIMLLVGIAGAVAAGFAITLWSQSPGYTTLYGDLAPTEAADVAEALRSADISYKLNSADGSIMVPEAKLHDARLRLASQGLPQGSSAGMGMMNEQSSFGVSQFMESARYQHALETELARTIASIGAVREARVHLAIPKQSTFLRDQRSASASVLLQLFRGRSLEQDQAAAVVNLVASSVPNLSPKNVTLIDQFGTLLSTTDEAAVDAQATSQFKYARRLEETYTRRIEELLTPLVGPGNIRAQVVADIDFTVSEETRESFDPARTVIRSEQTSEETRKGSSANPSGVPGALSNQPPEAVANNAAGDAPAPGAVDAAGAGQADAVTNEPVNTSRMSTRNFEVDRTISHTRPQAGIIRRLSVAVLVDDTPPEGSTDAAAPDDQAIARYTALVKEAVGFNEQRGDTVVVMTETFHDAGPIEVAEPLPIWKQPMLRDILKQVLGALIVLAIAFGVVRPMLRGVLAGNSAAGGEYVGRVATASAAAQPMQPVAGGPAQSIAPPNYDEKVAAAKNITGHDPARVAQVVKQWVAADE